MLKLFNIRSKLLEKNTLAENIYELKYEAPEDFTFTPGQFAGLRITPTHTRAYSIVNQHDGKLEFLVDTKPAGTASLYFDACKVGDELSLLGPYGRYALQEPTLNKVFISTSTGIAPFIPMIKALRQSTNDFQEQRVWCFFGVGHEPYDIAYRYFEDISSPNFRYIRCVTRHEPTDSLSLKGRVTEVVPQIIEDYAHSEFYICGSTEMILAMEGILRSKGADKIYYEKYG